MVLGIVQVCVDAQRSLILKSGLTNELEGCGKGKDRMLACEERLQKVCLQIVRQHRLKTMYNLMSSGNRTKVSSALNLLVSIVHASSTIGTSDIVGRLVHVFDFSLNALHTVSLPPKVAGGKMLDAINDPDNVKIWYSKDVSKRPTRAAFVDFVLGLLEHSDPVMVLPHVLRLKPILGNVFHYMSKDPAEVQEKILDVIEKVILGNHNRAREQVVLSISSRARFFTDMTLAQMAQIVVHGSLHSTQQVKKLSHKAKDLLVRILTDPLNGFAVLHRLKVPGHEGQVTGLWDSLHRETWNMSKGQRRSLRFLLQLRPWESRQLMFIMKHVFEHDPEVATQFIYNVAYDLEPKATSNWVVMMGVVSLARKSVAKALQSSDNKNFR